MDRQIAEKAAKWWANQLREPARLDHGDDSPIGGMTIMLATLLQEQERQYQTTEQIDAFETALADLLCECKYDDFIVSVDYGPDYTLLAAADKAGLDLGRTTLPWKTVMWIDGNSIEVACGYGAAPVAL